MNPQAQELNDIILAKNQAVFELLSERGKSIFFPKKGILGQSADAKSTRINATIGAAIEDDHTPMRLECINSKINLDPGLSFPYAPSFGRLDIRKKWKEMMAEKNPDLKGKAYSLPIVTNALTHGISMAGYMFVDPGQEILVPSLFWGNYNLTFINAYGGKVVTYNLFNNGAMDVEALANSLLADGDKKVLLLNFPNNPTGYSPTFDEMNGIVAAIKNAADKGKKIVVICDDAYFGLIFEDGIDGQSPFAYLSDLHENVLAVKVDGPTKEDYVWGFRIGFITYAVKGGDAQLYDALESKTAGAVRGNISNSSNLSQSLLLQAFDSPTYKQEKKSKFDIMQARYSKVKEVLQNKKYEEFFKALPYNSGYFMCVKLKDGLDGEDVRKLLINKYSIGTINLNNMLRVAFSAVAVKDVQELFDGIYAACKELS
ncbi:MAG: aminotransferase class I/II-fold pyridoxal phosphate-dependent enzyme [Marinilabiliaceae bacterium]|nr:aminotransferase class I/II-fold pyridoxal phosphate-dependent enzyme [Marinilabiliaceae bacterium]